MMNWWRDRNPRERFVLTAGAVVAAAILLYAVLAPVLSSASAAEARVRRKQEDLQWLLAAAPQVLAASGSGAMSTPATADNALVVIDRVSRESGLGGAVNRVEPAGGGQFQATLRDAPFENVIAWLARLRQQHGIAVAGFSLTPTAAPGIVQGSIQFKVGGV